jgi:hypothetical protein
MLPDHPVDVLRALGLDVGEVQRSEDLVAAGRSRDRQDRLDSDRRAGELASPRCRK